MKIKKTVTLNKKKGIIPFIKSYFEVRILKKKTFHCARWLIKEKKALCLV